uniref:uncharacterized protein LOC122587068 n=1 Tax=Erigeron canadensis TaxID=72917 RepID=UPI001CB98C8C|nr:uncharacterized protein LOC122587068 [Erigeron canadensis]
MKFTGSFQCLMGGNAVQFHGQSSSSSVLPVATKSSPPVSLHAHNDNDNKNNINSMKKTKTKKTKKKKKKKTDHRKVIRLFKPDGEINLYNKPIKVSEVMIDEYMVCRSDSFYIGQKIPPLDRHERLERGHTYFLLPAHLFHTVLSFVTIASFTSKQKEIHDVHETTSSNAANMKMKAAFLKKAAASSCSPFDIQKTASGTLSIRVSEMFISQLMMEQGADVASRNNKDNHDDDKELLLMDDDEDVVAAGDVLCTTPQLHREYKQLVVGSRRCWKPKLEMIKETPPKGKRKVKLLLSASFSRMKKKMKKNKKVDVPDQISSSSTSASKKISNNKKIKKTVVKAAVSLRSSSSVKVNKFSKIK